MRPVDSLLAYVERLAAAPRILVVSGPSNLGKLLLILDGLDVAVDTVGCLRADYLSRERRFDLVFVSTCALRDETTFELLQSRLAATPVVVLDDVNCPFPAELPSHVTVAREVNPAKLAALFEMFKLRCQFREEEAGTRAATTATA